MAGFMSDFFRFWPVLVLIRLNRNDAGSSGLVPRTPAGHRCWRATPVDGHHRRAPRADHRRARTADPGPATAVACFPLRRCDRRHAWPVVPAAASPARSEEHASELQSLMRISYAVFCLKKKTTKKYTN